MNLTRKLKDDYDAIFADVDVLVMPTVNQPARRHAPPEAGPLAWTQVSRACSRRQFTWTAH